MNNRVTPRTGRAPIGAVLIVTILGIVTVAIYASVFALVLSRT